MSSVKFFQLIIFVFVCPNETRFEFINIEDWIIITSYDILTDELFGLTNYYGIDLKRFFN